MKTLFPVLLMTFSLGIPTILKAQQLNEETRQRIGTYLSNQAAKAYAIGKIRIDSSAIEKKTVKLYASDNLSYLSWSAGNTRQLYQAVSDLLPEDLQNKKIEIYTDNHSLSQLITGSKKQSRNQQSKEKPLVSPVSRVFTPEKGLNKRHIALWQSHGYYFEPKLDRWEWQRARIFETVEDLYTQSYVLPFLVPMLENAGANVLIPRERDFQYNEIIVDNDKSTGNSDYNETEGRLQWQTGKGNGFAQLKSSYRDTENPFSEGSFRQITTTKSPKEEAFATWIPNIPEAGRYAVYVSYQTLPNSTDDALYTIHHRGGESQFKVNQKMGGGTWLYLGHFSFDEGKNSDMKITLSNRSQRPGRIVTADAIKIGGGMGNIARKSQNPSHSEYSQYTTSNYPRFTEASRYWLQWAGMPDSIYTPSANKEDYTDDYRSRARWVNYISGGSRCNPDQQGLNIPVDMAFAFHTDAGTTMDDSIIGTLGIFSTKGDPFYKSDRYLSRDLTDRIMSNIVNDIRTQYEPQWQRRGMWNKQYNEAYVPRVPTMLLELLSHQNFADMRYGLDPEFRFTVSRAIYKGMLRFMAQQYHTDYIVQPLPVNHFNIQFVNDNNVELQWTPVNDPLEPTAVPDGYIVYTRVGEADFDNGTLVNAPRFVAPQQKGVAYSYKITAINKGGESFPSEILSAYKAPQEKGIVMIINGFDRISAPASFVADKRAGFSDRQDFGVPYLYDISHIGSQHEFRREIPWMDDDAAGFGASWANYEKEVIAGNTFDYPALHGQSIAAAGYSYVSASDEAVMDKMLDLTRYKNLDLIMGKEREVEKSRSTGRTDFKTFPVPLQLAIAAYCNQGGHILVSGAHIASDLWDKPHADSTDINFARNVLRYQWRTDQAAITGKVKSVPSPFAQFEGEYQFSNTPNKQIYHVESPDAIEPVGKNGFTVFRYAENNLSAGVAAKGSYNTCILGFPFETITSSNERHKLMAEILQFLNH